MGELIHVKKGKNKKTKIGKPLENFPNNGFNKSFFNEKELKKLLEESGKYLRKQK
jgi:hypothetical protein